MPSHFTWRSTAQGGQFSVITTPFSWSFLGYQNHHLNNGDTVLVYKDGSFTHAGYVCFKLDNEVLARQFWGQDAEGKTWQLIYFLKDLSEVNIQLETFREAVGYKPKFKPQGFLRLKDENLNDVLSRYGSLGEFINHLSGHQVSLDVITDEESSFIQATELVDEEENREREVEAESEKIFAGLSEEESKRRASLLLRKMLDKATNRPAQNVSTRRYERGPAGKAMKELYDYRCMVDGCGFTFLKKNGDPYAESHHLEALSRGGLDDPRNIVVLCPNHHAQFHHARIEIESRTDQQLILKINGVENTLMFRSF
jgi:hypothetical protein